MSKMDNKLFQSFTEETEIPETVNARIENTLTYLKNEKQEKTGRRIHSWKKVRKTAIVAVACIALTGTGVYAVGSHFGLFDFMERSGLAVSEDTVKKTQTDVGEKAENALASFEVKEALYDNNSVYITVEVQAVKPEKYLLVPEDVMETDTLYYLGIESEQTVGEYAAEKGRELLFIGAGFQFTEELAMDTYSRDFKSISDDKAILFLYGSRRNGTSEPEKLDLFCTGSAREKDAKSADDVYRCKIPFTLQKSEE